VRELAGVALLAETALVVLADKVSYARSFFLGDIMAVCAVWTSRAVAFYEV